MPHLFDRRFSWNRRISWPKEIIIALVLMSLILALGHAGLWPR